jgi:microcystin-dependent protein
MAHTNNWDETTPTNATLATDIDDHIRKVRQDVRERLAVDHKMSSSDDADVQYGVHKKVTFEDPIAEPTLASGESCIYPDTNDDPSELRYLDSLGISNMLVFVGQVTFRLGTTVPEGWLALNGETIGDAASGADNAATSMEALFTYLWDNLADSEFAVSSGRGVSAAADWAAHKTGTLPTSQGRVPLGTGTGSGLTARTIGDTGGAESFDNDHTHAAGAHVHAMATSGSSPTAGTGNASKIIVKSGFLMDRGSVAGSSYPEVTNDTAAGTGNVGDAGSATQSIMNPFIVLSYLIKY